MSNQAIDTAIAKAVPPLGVAATSLAGIALQDWVYVLTITYTLFLIGEKLWKWRQAWKGKRRP